MRMVRRRRLQVTARGFCWGNSVDSSIKAAVTSQASSPGSVPTFGWIGSKGKVTQKYAIFVAELPPAWCGTKDVVVGAGTVSIVERDGQQDDGGGGGGRTVVLEAKGLPLS
jgi:hypothetical protein